MKLHHANLVGVLILAALCVAQWQRDRELNLELNGVQRTANEQALRLAEREKAERGLSADLQHFKGQFSHAEQELRETRQKLTTAERELSQLDSERDQLKTSVTNWAAAVATRDQRLREASEQTRRLAGELNASILKFNELATNHNAAVRDLNELRSKLAQAEPTRAP